VRINPSAAGAVQSSQSIQNLDTGQDFMTLLVAQLQAQDPMDPMKPAEFMSQLAQLQTVAELSTISATLDQLQLSGHLEGASSLIGRTAHWLDPSSGSEISGQVESVELTDGRCHLVIDDHRVALNDLIRVS
jgi:flagellar basal-body rod modification protein FlgD